MDKPEATLCYINDSGAYFTTQDLATQWGMHETVSAAIAAIAKARGG